MKIMDNANNLMDKLKKLDKKQLGFWKNTLIFLICADIFGVFWFLHQKKIGITLMVVFLIGLGLIMFLESKLPQVKVKTKKKEVKHMPQEEAIEEKEQEEDEFSFGLPSSEEYNKRLDDAFAFKGLNF